MKENYDLEGFVQCVTFNPAGKQVFFAGTSRNKLYVIDRNIKDAPVVIDNKSMVNSMYNFTVPC